MGVRGPKLSRPERAITRDRIIELGLRNYSQAAIARLENVTPQYVSYVLLVEQRWLRRRSRRDRAILTERQVAVRSC